MINLYHGSPTPFKGEYVFNDEGHDSFGTGVYACDILEETGGYGNHYLTIPVSERRIRKPEHKMPQHLTNALIKRSLWIDVECGWWTNYGETPAQAIPAFRQGLTGLIGDDIPTLWYECWRGNEREFCHIVTNYFDAVCWIDNGYRKYTIYNMKKVAKATLSWEQRE